MYGTCCPGKPNRRLRIGGQEVGISGFDQIMARGLEVIDGTDDEQRRVLLDEMKRQNYVPPSGEGQ